MTLMSRIASGCCTLGFLLLSGQVLLAAEPAAQTPPRGEPAARVETSPLESIIVRDLRQHINVLASDTFEGREAGSRGGRAAGVYLGQEFRRIGLQGGGDDKGYYQEFGQDYRNLLGVLPGSDPELRHEVLLIGAHYDHVGFGAANNSSGPIGYIHNGADDNASGVSSLLEVAEAFQQLTPRPRRTIVFALWDAEEKGLLGSRHWLSQPTFPLQRIKLVLNLDMVGMLREQGVELIGVRTSRGLRRLAARSNARHQLRFTFPREVPNNSDHYPFYEQQVPVLMPFTGFHNDYHRPSDDVEKLNIAGIEQIARWTFEMVLELANQPDSPRFRRDTEPALAAASPRSLPLRLGASWDTRDLSQGRLLTQVKLGSAAERAGLRVGDRLLQFGPFPLTEQVNLRHLVLSAPKQTPVSVLRAGEKKPTSVVVDLVGAPIRLGMAWRGDESEPGMVTISRIDPDTSCDLAGLQVEDRIFELNGESFETPQEFYERIGTLGNTFDLSVERDGRPRQVRIEVPRWTE